MADARAEVGFQQGRNIVLSGCSSAIQEAGYYAAFANREGQFLKRKAVNIERNHSIHRIICRKTLGFY
jgi:hypothetical protein